MKWSFAFASLSLASGCLRVEADFTPNTIAVEIPFQAVVGEQAFACGAIYDNVGSTETSYQPMEFRLFVHNVRLVDAQGQEVAVDLTEDGVFQGDGVALLDFADTAGLCSNGTAAINTKIVGTAPFGEYSGLRFTLGVPFAQNHQDVTVAPAPLNDLGLFWGWQFGFLFARIEGATTGLPQGHNFHLGSTDCAAPAPGENGTTGCNSPNRVEVNLPGFLAEADEVVVDLAALFADSDLDANTEQTAVGCMSFPDDPECDPIFSRLGLPYGAIPANPGVQSLFSVGERCAVSITNGPVPVHCR